MANVRSSPSDLTPLLEGDDLPWHWVRRVDNDLLIFFAHPIAKRLRYPMPYGLSKSESGVSERDVVLRWNDRETRVSLRFEIGESLMLFASGEGALKIVQILFE